MMLIKAVAFGFTAGAVACYKGYTRQGRAEGRG